MKEKVKYLSGVLIAALTAGIVSSALINRSRSVEIGVEKERSAFAKIVERGSIKCGYVVYPPGFSKDPNTGEISGVFPDMLEQAADNLGLKVEYVEEVGWGTMVEGLLRDRYDLIASPVWPLAQRAKVADFSQPIYFGGAEAFVRFDEDRFSEGLSALNSAEVKIATIDGEVTDAIATSDYPKAKKVTHAQATEISQLLLSVASGKADVTFVEPYVARDYMDKNPGKIKPASPGNPVRVYPNTMMLSQDDVVLRRVLDNALTELVNNGYLERVLLKYEPYPGAFYRPALQFRSTGSSGN